ncbi:ABC transporter permease [Bifidobacterium moukalabense]|uniref:ABC transporter permease n=1 Tax=Bifidobacterium moukalabense TaxID=1333651 RepID=UPI0010F8507C|nr:ABC transporter permease [Bifidobacterium moukalabense]
MIRIGLRDARSHFSRFIMSIVAIALGVSFVVGSFCFREMLDSQVSQMMATNADHDVYVRGAKQTKSGSTLLASGSSMASYNAIDVNLADDIAKVKGVSSARVVYSLTGVVLVDNHGDAVTTMGSPSMAIGISASAPWRSAKFTSGTYPQGEDEIALHSFAAERSGLKVGDKAKIVYSDGPHDVTVSGIFSTSASQAGAIIIGVDPSVAKAQSDKQSDDADKTAQICVYGNAITPLSESEQQRLADRINKALPKDSQAHAVTGDEYRDDSTKATQDSLGFIQPLILIFAVIALFVGSFIIANTFSMIVRESMRGYALLRSIGASPAQVFSTVIVQAMLLGLVGSGVGIALGWGMVRLIVMGLANMGLPLTGAADPSISDMVIGLIVGVLVTLVGAALPARNAALAPPIQAMNETVNPEKPVRLRGIAGTIMVVLGFGGWAFACAMAATDGDGPTPWDAVNHISIGWPLGIGAALIVIGVIMAGPAFVSPAGNILGWLPSRIFTVTGRLATRNISRSKRRTSNTAAALFVGVAIVSCLGVVASSAKASVNSLVDNGFEADFAVTSASFGRLPDEAIADIRNTDGVKTVTTNRLLTGVKYDGRSAGGVTFATQTHLFTDVFAAETTEGDAVKALRNGELLVGKNIAEDRGWHVGDRVEVSAENTVVDKEATEQAQADYQAQVQAHVQELQNEAQRMAASGDLAGAQAKTNEIQQYTADAQNIDPQTLVRTKKETTHKTIKIGAIVSNSVYRDNVMLNDDVAEQIGNKQTMFPMSLYVKAKAGTDIATVKRNIKNAVKKYYTISVFDRDEYKSTMSSLIDQVLMILYALLALSIIIAIFGIVNTLALSVSERTREIGLLRAIGTSRGQVRGMLGIEAAVISVFGTVMGLAVGVSAGVVIRAVYASEGLETLAVPWTQLLIFLALSIVVGLVSSISPASRALRQPVLDAVASE